MDTESFYSKHAATYGDTVVKPISFGSELSGKPRIQVTYEMLRILGKFENFLDIGCGDLSNLVTLEELFHHGYGVDLVKYPTWPSLSDKFSIFEHNLDAGSSPFASDTFDCVTLLMVLEHVFDPFFVIEDISRITKPGGYLVINVPNITYIKHRVGLLMGKLPITSTPNCWKMREWDGGHLHYFTLERLRWLLRHFGQFEVIEIRSSGKLTSIKKLWPSLLCSDLNVLCKKVL